ncbi:hypothetical protein [Mesorhizobium amorphae]|uniref:hypothetical protein n=1 Tax=Mesorhizobium amorphae TaxID=71433 RepID=UPI001AEEC6AD|nr:hypothetical protein [Mesorhizobium amorphae]
MTANESPQRPSRRRKLGTLDVGNFPTYDEASLWESILENPKPRAEIKRKRPQQYGLNRHELYFGNWIAQ